MPSWCFKGTVLLTHRIVAAPLTGGSNSSNGKSTSTGFSGTTKSYYNEINQKTNHAENLTKETVEQAQEKYSKKQSETPLVEGNSSINGPCTSINSSHGGHSGKIPAIVENGEGIVLSKSKGNGRDSGLQNLSDDELKELTKNTPHGKERDRLIREEKNRKLRNKQKRNNSNYIISFENNKKIGETISGVGIIILVSVALVVLVIDDGTGVGVSDDFLIPIVASFYSYGFSLL